MLVDVSPENGKAVFALETRSCYGFSFWGNHVKAQEMQEGVLDSIVNEVYKDAEPDPSFDAEDGIVQSFPAML